MDEPLDDVGVRVLGCLLEKELTTPDNYPLTLNALVAACNQRSSRDPVVEYDEATVSRGLSDLADHRFARGIHRGDARMMRYRQEIGERLHLHEPERAVLAVLLLRGPQTPGELKARTARVVEFVDASHVEITLESLATLSTPLVIKLPLQPGQKEVRWTHLLAGPPSEDAGEAAPAQGGSMRAPSTDRVQDLEQEVAELRAEMEELRTQFRAFRAQFE